MQTENRTKKRAEKPFSVSLFAVTIAITLGIFALLVKTTSPNIWHNSFEAPIWKWILTFLVAHFVNGFAEFFFHRYMLHYPFPFLKRLYEQHTLHHNLTPVTQKGVANGVGRFISRYPIIKENQYEASYFPFYALATFLAVSMAIVIPIQWTLSTWPIVLGTALAVTWSLVLYEIVHMIEHWSFEEFWKPKVFHPKWGNFWTKVYCFHLRHHADNKSNENISGFFTFPIADIAFGTYATWPRVYDHGEIVPSDEFNGEPTNPFFLIQFLDFVFQKKQTRPA